MDAEWKHGLKPVIQELVRTQFLFPDIELLVDKMTVVQSPANEGDVSLGAYLVWLTDGERSITGVFKRRMHKYVVDWALRAGSYIILRGYQLATAPRVSGRGSVQYIVISDFYLSGDDGRQDTVDTDGQFFGISKTQPLDNDFSNSHTLGILDSNVNQNSTMTSNEQFQPIDLPVNETADSNRKTTKEAKTLERSVSDIIECEKINSAGQEAKFSDAPSASQNSQKARVALQPSSQNSDLGNVVRMSNGSGNPLSSPMDSFGNDENAIEEYFFQTTNKRDKRERQQSSDPDLDSDIRQQISKQAKTGPVSQGLPPKLLNSHKDTSIEAADTTTERTATRVVQTTNRRRAATRAGISGRSPASPWAAKAKAAGKSVQPINRPLKLSTLASVTGVNCSKNKVVDVLARIESVDTSTTKPKVMPLKRDIRITDASTDRKVAISIFIHPVDCIPTTGDLVLFRNLVTHDYKGGALSAYPAYCEGKDWYIPESCFSKGHYPGLDETRAKILAKEREGAG